ncbi:MAG: cytochrome P460 family protein [Rhodospirillales bacterium]|nr:cytochrome P460 family protein [Rhodospirillales bacterium]
MPALRVATALLIILVPLAGFAQSTNDTDPLRPKRHFKVQRPASLSPPETLTIYDNIANEMAKGYAVSMDPAARHFRKWRRFNSAPYKSATHGNRYINNYVNGIGVSAYGPMESGEKMPAGSIIAKDSFTVTSDTAVFAGAFFVMEKLAENARPETGDWRYTMIMPDGSYLGDSEGDNADKVAFCHECHKSKAKNDYLFFIPKKYRMPFLQK